ncbi:hypothetical protein L486_08348 [Kwoniella mangroviensis CBS 10435]|uniref:Uncharacterized protein n=1 Tax=Kwoniella mangroviensis CBS 10435 TaxID=1331196 RepID=A0A1B9IFC2_9TREE|nr:uncharacterized protein I203_05064 [Kwoniella mangroviensis CBS 8507]OCF54151.1 hypothetical protein L486_08348 [Kwoniella mangroviensis CBS 10435]OCF66042.1 hypothetical protein I203_05064 [Kwoniella mangroviensis CBS 8507]
MSDPIELRPIGKSAPAPPPPPPPRHPATSSLGDALPGSLGRAYRSAEEKAKAAVHLQEGGMDAISIWGLGLASWFSILAIPLLLFPRILLFFSQAPPPPTSAFSTSTSNREDHYDSLSALESTLCLSISLGLFAISLISIFALVPTYDPPTINPTRKPILGILVGLTTLAGFLLWNMSGLVLGGGNLIVAIWGWWVIVFGNSKNKLSRLGNGEKKNKKDGKVHERFKRL